MMIAARNSFLMSGGSSTPTARDYVQNGLVAMWDGIENAGWGVHHASATVWKDLIGAYDWTLGPSASYEWTPTSFDAKNQYAATRDFIDDRRVSTVEACVRIKTQSTTLIGNYAYIILGRLVSPDAYYGILYRNPSKGLFLAVMSARSFFNSTVSEFSGVAASFSFPDFPAEDAVGYFDGVSRAASGSNTLDYNADTRGTKARIGGVLTQAMPIEVFNLRLYSRALTAAEVAANYAVDAARFGL